MELAQHTILALLALPVLAGAQDPEEAAAPPPAPPAAVVEGGDLAALVPAGAYFVARIESVDAVEGALRKLQRMFEPESEEELDLVGEIAAELELSAEALGAIDRERPVGVALSLDVMMETVLTLILPAGDPQALAAELVLPPEAGARALPAEGHVVLTQVAEYAPGGAAELAADLPDGLAVARVDLAAVIEAFRPVIDGSLEMAAGMAEMMATPGMMPPGAGMPPMMEDFDVGAIVDAWIDGAVAFLDSAESLDVVLDLDGDQGLLAMDLRVAEGSPMASIDWSAGGADLSSLAARLDSADPIQFAAALDVAAFMKAFEPWVEMSVAMYPEEMRDAMLELFRTQSQAQELWGKGFAGGGGFGPDGMAFNTFYLSPKPEELLETYAGMMEAMDLPGSGMEVRDFERTEIAGAPAVSFHLKMDPELLASFAVPDEVEPSAGDMEEMGQFLQMFFGPEGMRYVYAALDDGVAMTFGGGPDYAERAIRALSRTGGAAPPALRPSLGRVGSRSPSFVLGLDLGKILGQAGPLLAMVDPAAAQEFPANVPPAPMALYGSVGGRTWSLGWTADMAKLARFARAMEEF